MCVFFSRWPSVRNEGMRVYMVMMGIYSLIPYKGPANIFFSSPLNFMYMSSHLFRNVRHVC